MPGSKRETLNNIVLLVVLVFALKISQILPGLRDSAWYIPMSMLTATGVYVFAIRALKFVVAHNELLLRLYWGRLYLSGYWSYEYTRDGKQYFGIWRFEQDLDSIHVIGSGLNERFSPRTIVRSVSPLIEDQGAYWVINVRTELQSSSGPIVPVYSKTTLILDARKGFNPVIIMRATTEIFGGSSTGHLHPDVQFRKHVDATSDEDVIAYLKIKHQDASQLQPISLERVCNDPAIPHQRDVS
ncbi:MAG: hypothetical protein E6Q50_09270 [Lysobacter sp.]|nr:MAG: hypothetical protein E6Q50_09270 [Lysobacter sp.]